jgi:hypothetical protein
MTRWRSTNLLSRRINRFGQFRYFPNRAVAGWYWCTCSQHFFVSIQCCQSSPEPTRATGFFTFLNQGSSPQCWYQQEVICASINCRIQLWSIYFRIGHGPSSQYIQRLSEWRSGNIGACHHRGPGLGSWSDPFLCDRKGATLFERMFIPGASISSYITFKTIA